MHQAALLGEFLKVHKTVFHYWVFFFFIYDVLKVTMIINPHEKINIFMPFFFWHFYCLKDAQKYGWNVPEDRTLSW